MDTKARELLEKELESGFSNLGHMQPGSDEMSKATDDVAKLYKLKIEEDRLAEETKNAWIKTAVDAGKTVLQVVTYIGITGLVFRFEETGSICAKGSNMFLSNLKLPKL